MRLIRVAAAGLWVLFACTAAAGAQSLDQIGTRAQGMGGAFVAVANDASAVWWNPAALAAGSFFNALIEHQQQPDPGGRTTGFALATPPLGISYQHVHAVFPPAGSSVSGRQTESGDVQTTADVNVVGVTLLHSVTSGFVLGTTIKFVHGSVEDRGTSRGDLDVGAHYRVGAWRLGFVARNLTEPSLGTPEGEDVVLQRQARAGVAWLASAATTIAVDVDLNEARGPWPGRRVAFGLDHAMGDRLAIRGGLRLRTSDGPDAWVSVGGSYAVKSGIWVDGFWGRSPDQDARWGLSARLAY